MSARGGETWRLLRTPPAAAARNMAVDEALLLELAASGVERGGVIRLYGWSPPAVSIGRYQRAADLTLEARAHPGEGWVRRPTGGRALYHGPELTYAVVAPLAAPRVSGTVLASYRKIGNALALGLRELGVGVELAPCGDPARLRASASCFESAAASELLWEGRKLAGSAQLRHGPALLQHGSIPLDDPTDGCVDALAFGSDAEREAARGRARARTATLRGALGREVHAGEVAEAVARGFARCWGVELAPSEPTDRERARADELEAEKYRSAAWGDSR